MPIESINIAQLVADKIKTRYAEISEATFGSHNMVIDAFYPTYVRRSLLNPYFTPTLSKKVSCISPFLAKELNCFQIPIKDLTRMLGYSNIQLKNLLESVKAKKLELILVGLGGTGMNFIHWATELCNYTNSVNIFESIGIYDEDQIDLTNIFRFPMILDSHRAYLNSSQNGTDYKIHCINENSILSRNKLDLNCNFITKQWLLKDQTNELLDIWKNKIFYGAPDIQTREMFAEIQDLKFVSATHGNDDCQLYIKPPQDSNLQMESYGMINLSVFFMNQLKMTIAFLELLNSNEDLSVSSLIMDYSFAKEYANKNIIKAGLSRTYNFPINEHNFLDQESNILQDQNIEETNNYENTIITEQSEQVLQSTLTAPPPPLPAVPPYRDFTPPVQVETRARRRRTSAEMAEARRLGLEPPMRPRNINAAPRQNAQS